MAHTDTIRVDTKRSVKQQPWGIWRWVGIGVGIPAVLLVLAIIGMGLWMSYVPGDVDYAPTQSSNAGTYRVSYTPQHDSIVVNRIHTWTIHIETADGKPVEGAAITVDGDMPQHGHGFPTEPRVTMELGNGDYLVEGLKFHMPGWWVVDYTISVNGATDTVRFNLLLN